MLQEQPQLAAVRMCGGWLRGGLLDILCLTILVY